MKRSLSGSPSRESQSLSSSSSEDGPFSIGAVTGKNHSARKLRRRKLRLEAEFARLSSVPRPHPEPLVLSPLPSLPPGFPAISWALVPSSIDPSSSAPSDSAGGPLPHLASLPGKRGLNKRHQCESVHLALCHALSELSTAPKGRFTVVDFGSGTGNASLPSAFALRDRADFLLVDRNRTSINLARSRCLAAGLTNVNFLTGEIESPEVASQLPASFDVGLGVHVCGAATDQAISACIQRGSAIVMVPCCIGKIKHEKEGKAAGPGPGLPRSAWLRQTMTEDEYLLLARAADHNVESNEDVRNGPRRACKSLIEIDRLRNIQEAGYGKVIWTRIEPQEATPKNDVLIAIKK